MIHSSNGGLFFSKIRFRKVFYLVYFTILSKYYRVRLVCKSRRLILDWNRWESIVNCWIPQSICYKFANSNCWLKKYPLTQEALKLLVRPIQGKVLLEFWFNIRRTSLCFSGFSCSFEFLLFWQAFVGRYRSQQLY